MAPTVPSVIRVEDDAVSIVSAIDRRRPPATAKRNISDTPVERNHPVVSLNGQRKRVLSHSSYQKTLGTIIQRDYFPSPLAPSGTDLSVVGSSSTPDSSRATTTLTQFHSGAASDRQVNFQQQMDDHGRHHRLHVENTKYKYAGSKDQNAVFYPVLPRGQSRQNQTRIEALPMSVTTLMAMSSRNRTIVPDATRFPQPKPKVPQHWEKDGSVSTVADDDPSSNGFTDLDSTIVLSLRSEIRRGRQRKIRELSSSNKSVVSSSSTSQQRRRRRTIRPPLDSDESIGYALRKAYKRPRPTTSSGNTASVKH
jgi:hypothetical protein